MRSCCLLLQPALLVHRSPGSSRSCQDVTSPGQLADAPQFAASAVMQDCLQQAAHQQWPWVAQVQRRARQPCERQMLRLQQAPTPRRRRSCCPTWTMRRLPTTCTGAQGPLAGCQITWLCTAQQGAASLAGWTHLAHTAKQGAPLRQIIVTRLTTAWWHAHDGFASSNAASGGVTQGSSTAALLCMSACLAEQHAHLTTCSGGRWRPPHSGCAPGVCSEPEAAAKQQLWLALNAGYMEQQQAKEAATKAQEEVRPQAVHEGGAVVPQGYGGARPHLQLSPCRAQGWHSCWVDRPPFVCSSGLPLQSQTLSGLAGPGQAHDLLRVCRSWRPPRPGSRSCSRRPRRAGRRRPRSGGGRRGARPRSGPRTCWAQRPPPRRPSTA